MTAAPAPAAGVAYRLAEPDDLLACAGIWRDGINDYERRLNQPDMPRDLDPVQRLLAHFQATDPQRFWVATRSLAGSDGRRIVGFGSAVQREHVWFLSMLFVHPDEQAAGLGRALLEKTFPREAPLDVLDDGNGTESSRLPVMATSTDSVQPISNALYAGYGMIPRVPVFRFVGRPDRPDAFPALPAGVIATSFEDVAADGSAGVGHRGLVEAVDAIDRTLLRYAHPQDHRFLRVDKRRGYLYRDSAGATLGYGYTSTVGKIGPLAVLDEALLPGVLGHLIRVAEPRGASVVWVPGAAERAFQPLLEAGFRIEGFPALLCWNTPFVNLERYLPISLALL